MKFRNINLEISDNDYLDANLKHNNRLTGKIDNLEKSLKISKDETAHGDAMSELNKTLQKLEEELEDHPGSWLLGSSFSALDMFLAVVLHELYRFGHQNIVKDKPHLARLVEEVQFNSSYKEVLGPVMNKDLSGVGRESGAYRENTDDNESSGADVEPDGATNEESDCAGISPNLKEKKKARKKASEDRSWYNLW